MNHTDITTTQGMPQRRAMARAITLLESTRADHRAQADNLLAELLPYTGGALRLGISGVPGVGKSTFIESFGLHLIECGHRVAVLAIDPSSSVSGGSILGDKTRMERLSSNEAAFIRPSPSSGTLGGVADKTGEAMLVCEAAGYDVVIVETVGVGQSETTVHNMTDLFCVLQLPNAGDDLQAIKKGVMELADLVVINKADIDANAARRARSQIQSALRLHHTHDDAQNTWQPKVKEVSALNAHGLADVWQVMCTYKQQQTDNGQLAQRRQTQARAWMWQRIETGLRENFNQHPAVRSRIAQIESEVAAGTIPASVAARQLLAAAGLGGV